MKERDDGKIELSRREAMAYGVPLSHAAGGGFFDGLFGGSDDDPDGPGLLDDLEIRHEDEHVVMDPEVLDFMGDALEVTKPNEYDAAARIKVAGDVAVEGEDISPASVDTDSVDTDDVSSKQQPSGPDGSYVGEHGGLTATVSPSLTTYKRYADPFKTVGYQNGGVAYAWKTGASTVHKSTDYGETWSKLGDVGVNVSALYRIEATGTLLALDTNNDIHQSTDDGSTWTNQFSMNHGILGIGQSFSETPNGNVLVGEYSSGSTATFRIYRSTDDGASWSTVYTTDSTRGDSANPGHVHNVQYDPTEGAFVALLDYPNIRVIKSTDDGATWSTVADESKAEHPNFVSLMFFDDWVVWGYDSHGMNGWIRKMKRLDFYSGDWALENIHDVAKVNDKMAYFSHPVDTDTWLLTFADESNEHPGAYATEAYIVYDDGHDIRVTGGLEHSNGGQGPNGTSGTIMRLPAYPYDAAGQGGNSFVNLDHLGSPSTRGSVPFSVGENNDMERIDPAFASSPILPNNTALKGRDTSGGTERIVRYDADDSTVISNSKGNNQIFVNSDGTIDFKEGGSLVAQMLGYRWSFWDEVSFRGNTIKGMPVGSAPTDGSTPAGYAEITLNDGTTGVVKLFQ